MDRDLRIRLLLEAGDRFSRPLRDLTSGSTKAAQALKGTRDRLKEIEATQGDIGSFRRLKTGLRTTEQALAVTQTRVGRLSREITQSANPTRAMTRELAQARQEAQRLTRQQEREAQQLQQLRDRLRTAGVATNDLARHERELRTAAGGANRELEEQTRRLAQAEDRQRRMASARSAFGRTQGMATGLAAGGAAAIGTGVTMGRGIWEGVKAAQEYESAMTDIAQKADLPRAKAVRLGKELLVAAQAANQLPAAMQAGVDGLAGLGATVPNAVAMMTPIGRAATAYKAEVADLSAAAYAATDNLKVPTETQKVIDVMATAGKAGAFEIKDMAQYFPALTAAYQGLGQTGTASVADLAAGLQIARKGAGDAATAGTNLSNVIQKISSPATARAFKKMGVDLPAALKKAYAEGKTPLEAIAELTNKTLKGDLSKLGYLFEDAQVQQGLRPLIQNMELFRSIRAQAMAGGGTIDDDFAERMNDSSERSKQLAINAQVLGVSLGTILLPTVNAVSAKAAEWASKLADLTQRHPVLAKVVGIGAMALAGLFVVLGGGAIVMAGVMMPIAMINAGLVAMGVSGGLASIGLFPIIATVLAVAGVVALLFAAFTHWHSITAAWFAFWGTLQGGLFAAGNFIKAWGPTIGRALLDGLLSMLNPARLVTRIWSIGKAAIGAFKAVLGIHSPSRVFAGLGGFMMAGLDAGLADNAGAPMRRIERLGRQLGRPLAAPRVGRLQDLSRAITGAVAIGAVATSPALAGATPTGPTVGMAAPSGPIEIHIHPPAGSSPTDIARAVRAEIEKMEREKARARGSTMTDPPDWT